MIEESGKEMNENRNIFELQQPGSAKQSKVFKKKKKKTKTSIYNTSKIQTTEAKTLQQIRRTQKISKKDEIKEVGESMIHLDGRSYEEIISSAKRPTRMPPVGISEVIEMSSLSEEEQPEIVLKIEDEPKLLFKIQRKHNTKSGNSKKKQLFYHEEQMQMAYPQIQDEQDQTLNNQFKILSLKPEEQPAEKKKAKPKRKVKTKQQQMFDFLKSKYQIPLQAPQLQL